MYPLPKLSELLACQKGYESVAKLDISMQYYIFRMDEESKKLCTFAMPFGLYQYCHLPMGVSESPNILTEIMTNLFSNLMDVDCYMDDIGCFSPTWPSHLTLLSTVLSHLQKHGFTINLLKCEWAVKETNFHGHWLTHTGLKPWHKKINVILNLQPPMNVKELQLFVGLINYYRDMWPRQTHIITPLTGLTRKGPFCWTTKHQQAFEQMNALIAADTLLAYPNHTQPFDIKTDASDYQLGAVMEQSNHPIAYYSHKLTSIQ